MAGLVRSTVVMSTGTVVSRILGFVKAIVLAQAIGVVASAGADSFAVANQLPNNLYAIVAGGVLGATLVPSIARSAAHDDRGSAYISKLITIAVSGLVVITAFATLLAPVLIRIYATHWTDNQLALATAFAYWCLPQIFFYGLYTLLGEVLHGRSIFGPATWAPLVNNVISIAGLGAFIALFGADSAGVRAVTDWTSGMVALLAGTATLGIAAQAIILLVFWRRTGVTFRVDFRWRGVGLGETGKMASWTMGMILLNQVAGLIETNVSALASGKDASVFALQTAWLGFMLPHSIITVSLATAYFTRLSHHAAAKNFESMHSDTSDALRRICALILWGSAALIAAAVPFARLFAHDFAASVTLGAILILLLIGLPAFSGLHILMRVFFALGDGKTPFMITAFQAVLVSLAVVGCAFLPHAWIVIAIAVSLSVIGTAQTLLAAHLVRRRLGVRGNRSVAASLVRSVIAGVAAISLGSLIAWALGSFAAEGFAMSSMWAALVSLILIGVVATGAFVVALRLVGSHELNEGLVVFRSLRSRALRNTGD